MKTEKITRPSQLKDGDRVNFNYGLNRYFNEEIIKKHGRLYSLSGIMLGNCDSFDFSSFIMNVQRIIHEPINEAIESINVDFKNNVVTTVYVGEKPKKDRYFTDGFTVVKNPKVINNRIEFESHICLNTYSKGGWLPLNVRTVNWAKASKKQRKEFKKVESESL